jgi:hypothetical protein
VTRGGAKSTAAPASQTIPATSTAVPTTTLEPQNEVIGRLREILRIRDHALAKRDANLLETIYTVDCNCLAQSRALIHRLRKEHVVWNGLSTSLKVQQVQKVNDRLWNRYWSPIHLDSQDRGRSRKPHRGCARRKRPISIRRGQTSGLAGLASGLRVGHTLKGGIVGAEPKSSNRPSGRHAPCGHAALPTSQCCSCATMQESVPGRPQGLGRRGGDLGERVEQLRH